MARVEIRIPHLGESSHEAVIVRWYRQPGDRVARGERLLEIETDKVDAEIDAPEDGWLAEAIVGEGMTVVEGDVVGMLETSASAPVRAASPPAPEPVPRTDCLRCGAPMERANASLPFARVRLLVCRACGHVEMMAEDPRTF